MGVPARAGGFLRRLLIFLLKMALAGALVAWLLRSGRLDLALLRRLNVDAGVITAIAVGVASVLAGQFPLAWRLQLFLRAQGVAVSFGRAFGVTMIGALFGAVLPGLVGGDAVKALYLLGDAREARSRVVAAVLVDRVIGLYALFLLGSLALLAAWAAHALPVALPVLIGGPAALLGLTLVLAAAAWPGWDRHAPARRLQARLPRALRDLGAGFRDSLRRPRLLVAATALSLANHALVIVTYLLAGRILRDSVSTFQHFVADPLAMVLNVLPLTPGGIGITEGAFSFLFSGLGSPNGAAIGLLGRMMQYVDYVAGGTLALLAVRFSRRGRSAAGEPPAGGGAPAGRAPVCRSPGEAET